MSSGVEVDDSCVAAFNLIKSGKQKYAILKINDDYSRIIVDESATCKYKRKPDPADFEQFLTHFPHDGCRYGIFLSQIGVQGSTGMKGYREKIVFVVWAPDSARIKDKMLVASSKAPLKSALQGINYNFQFSDEGEAEATEWIDLIAAAPVMKMAGEVIEFEGRSTDDW